MVKSDLPVSELTVSETGIAGAWIAHKLCLWRHRRAKAATISGIHLVSQRKSVWPANSAAGRFGSFALRFSGLTVSVQRKLPLLLALVELIERWNCMTLDCR